MQSIPTVYHKLFSFIFERAQGILILYTHTQPCEHTHTHMQMRANKNSWKMLEKLQRAWARRAQNYATEIMQQLISSSTFSECVCVCAHWTVYVCASVSRIKVTTKKFKAFRFHFTFSTRNFILNCVHWNSYGIRTEKMRVAKDACARNSVQN